MLEKLILQTFYHSGQCVSALHYVDNLQPKFVQFFVTAAFKPDWLEYLEYSWLNLLTMKSN